MQSCISHVPQILCFSSKLIYCGFIQTKRASSSGRTDTSAKMIHLFSALFQSSFQWAPVSRSWLKLNTANPPCELGVLLTLLCSSPQKEYL